jgi:hypothetical protein
MNLQISNKELDSLLYILYLSYENILDIEKRDYLLLKVNKTLEPYEEISSLALKKALDELSKMGISNIETNLPIQKEEKLKTIVLAIYALNQFIETKNNDFTFELSLELLKDSIKNIEVSLIKDLDLELNIRTIFSKMV